MSNRDHTSGSGSDCSKDPSNGRQLEVAALPAGTYHLQVVDSEVMETQKGFQLTWELSVVGGKYAGYVLRHHMLLDSDNLQAEEINQRALKAMAMACGHPNPNNLKDSRELYGKEFEAKVTRRIYNGKTYNSIKSYKPACWATPGGVPVSAAPLASETGA